MKSLIYIMLGVAIVACDEITFREPQPKGRQSMSSVPPELQGKYIPVGDSSGAISDTIIIESRGFRIGYYDADEREQNKNEGYFKNGVGDSLVLRAYKGYYFWSFYEEPEWRTRVVRKLNNGDLIYFEPGRKEQSFQDFVNDLNRIVRVDTTRAGNEKLYQIDPSPKQLVSLIKKGYFTRSVLRKVQ